MRVLACIACVFVLLSAAKGSYLANQPVITHALGGIDGAVYTNSLEALQENYEKGQRVFEADFLLLDDEHIVLVRDLESFKARVGWQKDKAMTYDELMQTKIDGKFTPMDLSMLLNFMNEHPDMLVVTDIKFRFNSIYFLKFLSILVKTVQGINPALLDRVLPQLYRFKMYKMADSVYRFNEYILTLYLMPRSFVGFFRAGLTILRYSKVKTVVMPKEWLEDRKWRLFAQLSRITGHRVYVHTVNQGDWHDGMRKYVDGVYSDFLTNTEVRVVLWQ